MSIKYGERPNGHIAKKRRLSHDPDESLNRQLNHNDLSSNGGFSEEESDEEQEEVRKPNTSSVNVTPKPQTTNVSAEMATESAGKWSLISLQLNDLIREVRPNYDSILSTSQSTIDLLVSIIKKTTERKPIDATGVEKIFRSQGIAIPFPPPKPGQTTNYKFEFKQPESVHVRGASVQNLSIKVNHLIDLAVIMPKSMFQEKDNLNYRALHKRAFYLACITAAIKENAKDKFKLTYRYEDDCQLLPVLSIRTKDKSAVEFQISVRFPEGAISLEKTLPTKNCVRSSDVESNVLQQPTPFYNSCLLFQSAVLTYDDMIQSTVQKCPGFADACRIARVWLSQRRFGSSISAGGFGGDEWTIMCAILIRSGGPRGRPLFSEKYTSLQFFIAMLQVLSGKDLLEPFMIDAGKLKLAKSELPVFYDGSTGVNILNKMSPWSYQALKYHAQNSLSINSRTQESFDSCFIFKVSEPLLQFDEIFTIDISTFLDQGMQETQSLLHKLYLTLKRGLDTRVTFLDFSCPEIKSWDIQKAKFNPSKCDTFLQVAILNSADANNRLIDHGPSAEEQEEAADFRKFWGGKAELRRFRDGSITESLVWSANSPINLQIIQHLAALHFKLPAGAITSKTPNLETQLLADNSPVNASDSFKLINSTFQKLSSTLHQLDGLPLPIRSVMPADPALRSATLRSPLSPTTNEPVGIHVQFESSTRWPDSLPAIQHTKIAFLVKLSDLLIDNDSSLITRIGLEHTSSAKTGYFNTCYLDIIYPSSAPNLSPICFRTRIYHDRELHLLQKAVNNQSLHGSVRDTISTALAKYKRDFMSKPIHTTTIRSLCTRFAPLSGTIRLLKKWISSHVLIDHVPEELLEIIAAKAFLQPAPWSIPGSATTAFLRSLHFLSRWDWAANPLLIDLSLSQDMDEATKSNIQTRYTAWRKLDPSLNNVVWFVGTNLDPTGTVWTQGAHPPRVVAARITALARAAVEVLHAIPPSNSPNWADLFHSPLADFDFTLHLKPSVVRSSSSRASSASSQFKNLQLAGTSTDSIGYDPIKLFLADLRNVFDSAALFFYDSDGGHVIAGLWRPNTRGVREWRVRLGYSSIPVAGTDKQGKHEEEKPLCSLNTKGILAEISMLGDGLLKEIKVKEV